VQSKLVESLENSDPAFRLHELDEQEKKRAEERVSLRHKNKSKHIKNILRYGGDKKSAVQSVNDLAQMRKEILKKLDPETRERLTKEDQELEFGDVDDKTFKDKIMEELAKEIGEDINEEGKDKKEKKRPGYKEFPPKIHGTPK